MQKLTVELSSEEYRLIKILAKVQKTSMAKVVAKAVERRLNQPLFQ